MRSVPGGLAPWGGFPAGGKVWTGGNRGRGKGGAHCGTGFGVFEIKGLAAWIYFAFILSALSTPAVAAASPSLAAMALRIRGRTGADERRAGDMRDRLGTARAHDPRKSRPGPRNRLQAIALGEGRIGSAEGGDGADRAGAGGGPGLASPQIKHGKLSVLTQP